MRRPVIALIVTASVLVATGVASATMVAARPDDGLCRLLKAGEVREALGHGKWRIADDGDVPEQCYMHNGRFDDRSRAFSMRLLGSNEENQQEFRDDLISSGGTELVVAGLPAVQDDRDAVTVFFPDPWDMLQLSPVGFEDDDVATGIVGLAEVAAGRYAAETAPAVSPSASPDGSGSGLQPCDLLTTDEVSASLGGETVTANEVGPTACVYAGDLANGSLSGVTIALVAGTDATAAIAQLREAAATELTIGGAPALQTPPQDLGTGHARSMLVVMPDASTALLLSGDLPTGIDAADVVRGLAELAYPRLASTSLPSPAPSGPVPSVAPSAAIRSGLAGLFPAEIGGQPLTVETLTGREFLDRVVGFEPMADRVTKALRRRDRKLGDLSFAQGQTPHGSAILAFQVEGGRARQFQDVLLESVGMERIDQEIRPQDVAGKEGAFAILSGSQGVAYPSGEVLWLVFSFGDEQVEIFSKLP